MCFSAYHEWNADVYDDSTIVSLKSVRCDECGGMIQAGQPHRYIHMEEHECCGLNRGGLDADEECEQCPEGECDFGKIFDWDCCEACCKLLKAIEAVEIEEGCSGDETQPALGELYEAMTFGRESAERYIEKAVEMFPELVMSGHLGRFGDEFFCKRRVDLR